MSNDQAECDVLAGLLQEIASPEGYYDPHRRTVLACAFFASLTFLVSTASGNVSQVDKLWSVLPCVYAWMAVCDTRTLLMACLTTIWGVRLSWNFNRRGGYKWPPWEGDEDYRWQFLRDGALAGILRNPIAWCLFNLGFISVYQNLLLLLIASPSLVAWSVVRTEHCVGSVMTVPLNVIDGFATTLFLLCVLAESIADNQQWAFQTEKRRRLSNGDDLDGDYACGFCQSGLFSVVRKPNYAAEQGVWLSFYLFSVAAMGGKILNWSVVGSLLLILLFQGSGWFTELLSVQRYPKYRQYQGRVPLYFPNLSSLRRCLAKSRKED